jgi:hypothetical protein
LAAFFFATGFFLAAFLEEAFLLGAFLRESFFLETFFLATFLFAAGFLRATVFFFFDDFFADAFFFVTMRFLPGGFFLVTGLRFAAFLREAFAGLRFVLAVFFAGISKSSGPRKTRNYTLLPSTWKGHKSVFFQSSIRDRKRGRRSPLFRAAGQEIRAFEAILSFCGDNRFMPEIPLHYPDSHWRWANTTKCD